MPAVFEPTVSSAQMRDVYLELRRLHDAERIRRATGVTEADFETVDGRLPVSRSLALWEALREASGDPLCAFKIGSVARRGSMGVVAHLMLACANLREALGLVVRYFSLVNEIDRIDYREDDGFLHYTYECIDPRYYSTFPLERSLSAAVTWAGLFTGKAIRPVELHLRYARPPYGADIAEFFGCPVRFEREENAAVFSAADLDRPGVERNDYLKQVLEVRARELHERLGSQMDLARRIKAYLTDRLPRGEVGLDEVARGLGYSRSSLYRRLKEQGLTYQGLLDELRRELSRHYLEELNYTRQETAFLLGYSEASAFYRAYKRWQAPERESPKEGGRDN